MAKNPLEGFENKSRLLSEDEQQLVQVLARFYEHLEDHAKRITALEDKTSALTAALGGAFIVARKTDDG